MKRQLIALATSGAFLLAAGAAAADGYHSGSIKDAPLPVEESCCTDGWGGVFIAGSIGWGFAGADYTHRADGDVIGGFDDDYDGVTGTIAIGYDKVVRDGLLLGVFTDFTFGELDGTSSYDTPSSPPPNAVSLSYDNIWALGGRIGLVRDSMLFYATAGYTHAEFDASPILGPSDPDVEFKDGNLDGYFIGAGFEKMLRDCWSLKVEYRYSDYGKSTLLNETLDEGCTVCNNKIDVDNDIHSIRVGLSYRFNAPREQAEYVPLK